MTLTSFTIVKNEESTLPRMVECASGLVDRFVVVDTGSTDATVEVARDLGCLVRRSPFVDFGHNLSEAVQIAKITNPMWLLRLDADMVLDWHIDFHDWLEREASGDAYNVLISEGSVEWRLPLLMSARHSWRYVGRTHEYLDTTGRSVFDVDGIHVTHIADGGSRSEKFERDLELLSAGVRDGDPRSIFYSAESLRCIGKTREAIEMFDRRASMPGTWEEEAWYAEFRAAECAMELDPIEGAARLVKAHLRRPTRAEPLDTLRKWCQGQVSQMGMPNDRLFVNRSSYERGREAREEETKQLAIRTATLG